jgi:hypothetical protein
MLDIQSQMQSHWNWIFLNLKFCVGESLASKRKITFSDLSSHESKWVLKSQSNTETRVKTHDPHGEKVRNLIELSKSGTLQILVEKKVQRDYLLVNSDISFVRVHIPLCSWWVSEPPSSFFWFTIIFCFRFLVLKQQWRQQQQKQAIHV